MNFYSPEDSRHSLSESDRSDIKNKEMDYKWFIKNAKQSHLTIDHHL